MKVDIAKFGFAPSKHFHAVRMQQGRVQLDSDADELLAILRHLAEHPDAQDTLEGIVQWWLLEQRVTEAVRRVQELLDELVSQELVVCTRHPDGRTCYSFNRRKASAAVKRLRPPRKKIKKTR